MQCITSEIQKGESKIATILEEARQCLEDPVENETTVGE